MSVAYSTVQETISYARHQAFYKRHFYQTC